MTDDVVSAATARTSAVAPSEMPKYQADAARYIADMLLQLREIASAAGQRKVVRSIDEAYYVVYAQLGGQTSQTGNWKPHVPAEPGSG